MTGVQKGIKIDAIVIAIFIICIIINGIIMLIGSLGYSKGNVNYSEEYSNIRRIEIDLNTTNLEIKYGDKYSVEASNVTDKFKVRERNGNLYIEEDSFWLFGNNNAGKVVVYVPDALRELSIDVGAGKTSITGVSAQEFSLDYGAGVISINDSDFTNSEIDGGTGDVNINNTIFTNLELDTGVGEFNFNGQILGRNEINVGIGECNLSLTGGEELYTLNFDKGIGNITLNGTDYGRASYGNGNNIINIDNGIGDVSITFI